MKKLVLVSIVLVMMLALAVPMSSTSAQDKTKIDVWIAFSDYRLDWTQDVAAEFGELYPQFEVNVTGGYSYETLFTQVAVAAEQGQLPAIVHFNEVSTQSARDSGLFKSIAAALGDRTEINGIQVDMDDFIPVVLPTTRLDVSSPRCPGILPQRSCSRT